jgi:hypothetical protein
MAVDEEWIIVSSWAETGETAYYGKLRDGGRGLVATRGSAARFESENAALHIAYSAKERRLINDFTVEQVVKPRLMRDDGS